MRRTRARRGEPVVALQAQSHSRTPHCCAVRHLPILLAACAAGTGRACRLTLHCSARPIRKGACGVVQIIRRKEGGPANRPGDDGRYAAVVSVGLTNGPLILAQPPKTPARPSFRLPDEAAGIDGIAQTLIPVFDQAGIIALGEAHGRRADSDLRIALVRHPDFAKKVRAIVVEFGSTTEQSPTGAGLEDRIQRSLGLSNLLGLFHGRSRRQLEIACRYSNSRVWGDPGPTGQRGRETAAGCQCP